MERKLPQSLIDSIKSNNLIPFIGAGISMGIEKINKSNDENKYLFQNWTNSLLEAVKILENETKNTHAINIKTDIELLNETEDYLGVASKIKKFLNTDWNTFLTQTFDKKLSDVDKTTLDIPKELHKINTLLITTNYDNILKWACDDNYNLVEWDRKAIHGQVKSLKNLPTKQTIWYLHGKISNPDDIIFTKESYEEIYKENSAEIEVLKSHLLTKNFIFCGFSLDDPYIKMQLMNIKEIFGNNVSRHYMIVKKGQQKDFSYLGDIQFIEIDDYSKDYLKLLKEINNLKDSIRQTKEESKHELRLYKSFFNVPFESKKGNVVGIEEKIEEVHSVLNKSKNLSIGQVAKFEGMGGLGKTQLAVEYAYKYKENYKNGVFWLTMDQDLDEQILSLGKDYNLVNQNLEIKDQLDNIKSQIKSFEDMLLIYDNTNELKDIEKYFFPKSSTNKILITTRNPIQGFESIPLETLNYESSKKLLEIESGRIITESEILSVKEICVKLDGLPLALEMAGAYVKYLNLSWDKYLSLYEKHNIDLLNKSKLPESFTKHENNIANTLTISQKIIDEIPLLKEILNLLSYGASEPIDSQLIVSLLSCDETDIIEAVQIGIKLKYITESSQGYSIHRLLREVWRTQEKLETDFINDTAKNLSTYIYKIKDEFLNLSKLEKANLFSEQWINYLEKSDIKAILIAYRAYLDFYKGNFENGLKIVLEANELVEKKDSKEYAEILLYQGTIYNALKEQKIARDLYEQSLEVYKRFYQNIDHYDFIIPLNNLGENWSHSDFSKSLYFHTQSYELSLKLFQNEDNINIARGLGNLGTIWIDKDFDLSIDYLSQSLKMYKNIYPNYEHPNIAKAYLNLGCTWRKKDFSKALEYLTESYEMNKRLFANHNHHEIINSMFYLVHCQIVNPLERKKALSLVKKYEKIVTRKEDKEEIKKILKRYPIIGKNKSKRKKR